MNRDYLTAQKVTSFGQEEIDTARTLRIIREELMAQSFVNLMILFDDANRDETVAIAKAMKPSQGSDLQAESESLLIYTCNGIFRPEK